MAALSPDQPVAYFELGEEVADAAATVGDADLAAHLFVLALELNRRLQGSPGFDPTLTRSCCLALAEIPTLARERGWLLALAESDARSAAPDSPGGLPDADVPDALALETATLLGLARSGDAIPARKLLARMDVREVLERYERLLRPFGRRGGIEVLEELVRDWPCKTCRGARVVGRAPASLRLCPECRGRGGPRLSTQQLVAHLRFESHLLQGVHESWAGQLVADAEAPLREADLNELAPTLGIDARATLWRGGRWTRPQTPDSQTTDPPAPGPEAANPQTPNPDTPNPETPGSKAPDATSPES
ncbi:MAG: hypothetical protein SFZ23_09490 [Planctomycetota bacterium]|nr:hypothetical protein [Planctomycetota bacterium]